ncbi:MAG: fatty acid desaturase [Polyangiaceae bacterium]
MNDADLLLSMRPFAREDRRASWLYVLSTVALLAAVTAGAAFLRPWPLRLLASTIEGLLLVRTFILFHDFQHGAILRTSRVAQAFFWLYGMSVLTPPRVWRQTHNYHHANNAKIVGSHVGSYPVVTLPMWKAMQPAQRLAYRIARHPVTIALGYFTVFGWGMCASPFIRAPRKNATGLGALVLQIALAVVVSHWLGVDTWLFAVFMPLVIATASGSYLFYAQHNFEGIQLRARENWSYVGAALGSTSYMAMGRVGQFFTGNIGFHHVHHMNPGIPFYRLEEAMSQVVELQSPVELRLRWADVVATFRGQVWDAEANAMITIAQANRSEVVAHAITRSEPRTTP